MTEKVRTTQTLMRVCFERAYLLFRFPGSAYGSYARNRTRCPPFLRTPYTLKMLASGLTQAVRSRPLRGQWLVRRCTPREPQQRPLCCVRYQDFLQQGGRAART